MFVCVCVCGADSLAVFRLITASPNISRGNAPKKRRTTLFRFAPGNLGIGWGASAGGFYGFDLAAHAGSPSTPLAIAGRDVHLTVLPPTLARTHSVRKSHLDCFLHCSSTITTTGNFRSARAPVRFKFYLASSTGQILICSYRISSNISESRVTPEGSGSWQSLKIHIQWIGTPAPQTTEKHRSTFSTPHNKCWRESRACRMDLFHAWVVILR